MLKRERLVYHRQVAEALERLFLEQADEQAGLLAYHWERAGEPEKAVVYLLRAGEQTRLAYANEEAIDYYRRALTLMDEFVPDARLTALSGLGKAYFCSGKIADADKSLREAIALGQAVGLASRELVRIYWWLGEVLFWQGQYDEILRLAEKGLMLLGEDTGSIEAALMNHNLAVAHYVMDDQGMAHKYMLRSAQLVQDLPYVEELRPIYTNVSHLALIPDKNVGETARWLSIYEDQARRHHDLRALGEVREQTGSLLHAQGELGQAISEYEQSIALFERIGDGRLVAMLMARLSTVYLALGALPEEERCVHQVIEIAETSGIPANRMLVRGLAGRLFLCRGRFEEASHALQEAIRLASERYAWSLAGRWSRYLARAYLALGGRQRAREQLQTSAVLADDGVFTAPHLSLFEVLSLLEQASETRADFDVLCNQLREQHAQILASRYARFVGWRLELAEVEMDLSGQIHDLPLQSPDWIWVDPYGDCSHTASGGLEICAANGRDMWHINWSAPRMLRQISGDFCLQTVCVPAMDDSPAIAGLLLWQDEKNYLRLDRGAFGEHEIAFLGCLDNEDVAIGRGWLREGSERIFLRLERIGNRISAFCSADGEQWYTVGYVAFPVDDPIQVGLHAIGNIDHTVYHDAYPEGTAIRFESFQMWRS
ncbi:MAG: DUF1349 domain-containing protein [Anaerolineae bacterium]|nr:DUF1349 domain-containing protein [Anaerolineae bacterium]